LKALFDHPPPHFIENAFYDTFDDHAYTWWHEWRHECHEWHECLHEWHDLTWMLTWFDMHNLTWNTWFAMNDIIWHDLDNNKNDYKMMTEGTV
jgi:hypothetical protein